MTLPTTGQIKASDIANEFGYSQGSTNGIKLGDYRGQDFTNPNNTSVRVPTSENVTNDPNGLVKFSDFYGGRLTIVVNYFGAAAEIKPGDAYNRFTFPNLREVVGNNDIGAFKQFNGNNSAGKRIVILVNEDIGSDKIANTSCALRTGTGWDSDTILEVLVGPDGEIIGAGGNGGAAGGNWYDLPPSVGGFGTSGLGIQFEGVGGTRVTVQSGGRIAGGGGGGGGGAGAMVEDEERGGGEKAYADGGFGGGGAGLPAGTYSNGDPSATKETGGSGTPGTSQSTSKGNTAAGGAGGNGGNLASGGANGGDGSATGNIETWPQYAGTGAAGGGNGAAIRRIGGMNNIIIENLGDSSQIVGSTVETGVT